MTLLLFSLLACQDKSPNDSSPTPGDSEPTPDDSVGMEPLPFLAGVSGSDGALVWTDTDLDPSITLERGDGSAWTMIGDASSGTSWVDLDFTPDSLYRLRDPATEAVSETLSPSPFTVAIDLSGPAAFYNGETAALTLIVEAQEDLPEVATMLVLSWTTPSFTLYLDGECLDKGKTPQDCWLGSPTTLKVLDSLAGGLSLSQPPLTLDTSSPVVGQLVMSIATSTSEGDLEELGRASVEVISLGRGIVWGDPHAHSNISHDGCEEPDQNCANHVENSPGGDFFESAAERELDFAAMTDHSEWEIFYPTGSEEDPAYNVWEEQKAIVQAAEDGPVLPILGYEWTYSAIQEPAEDGHYVGGHKTVLFKETDVCSAWRIGVTSPDSYQKGVGGALFLAGSILIANGPAALFDALDAAALECGETEALTYFHHPAYEWPQPVDFTLDSNTPNPHYEYLLEVYSEHGSSECRDTTAPRCDWNLKSNSRYWEQGAVQTALAYGYQVGFTAGTDSHNSRPGSVDDGPSCTANFEDTDGDGIEDSAACHDWSGGITGVMIRGGLTRDSLWSGLALRNTIASSGPRFPLRAVVIGQDGRLFLPGDIVPSASMPARLLVSLEGAQDAEIIAIELLDPEGEIRAGVEGEEILETDLDLTAGEAVYIRVSANWGEEEHRMWASPFFGGE